MRIVEVSPYLYPHLGGVENHVEELSRYLSKRGHEVTVVTSNHDKKQPREERYNGYRIVRVKPHSIMFNTPIMPGLSEKLKEMEGDVFHVHFPPPITELLSIRALKKSAAPVVMTYHCDLDLPIPLGSAVTDLYSKIVTTYAVNYVDRLIMTSSSYAATSTAMWSAPMDIIPNAVDHERFNPNLDGDVIRERHDLGGKKVVMYVGRLRFHKGLEYFVEAAKWTPSNAVHLVVGEGDMLSRLRSLVKVYNLEKKVMFAGRVSYADLPLYYAACDMLVLPSVSRLEAFGIVGLEAMATAKPVIVSDIPGVRAVIKNRETGLLVEPFDSRDIAKKINFLLENPELRRKMGLKARKRVEQRYTWEKVSRRIESVFQDVGGGS